MYVNSLQRRKAKKAKLNAAQTMENSQELNHDCNTGRMTKSDKEHLRGNWLETNALLAW